MTTSRCISPRVSRFEALARRLVLVLGLGAGACTGNEPLPPSGAATSLAVAAPTRAALEAEASDDLARLRALSLVEVRDLVLGLPEASSACYGNPCPPDAWDAWVTDAYRRQVPRLSKLTDIAESVVANQYVGGVPAAAPGDIATLNRLGIVELGALLVAQPANDPRCYNLPCSVDVDRANTQTSQRAGWVRDWAARATHDQP